jgi:hypothetical protein
MAKSKPPLQQISVRLDDDTLARIDALLPVYDTTAREGRRSDVLRDAIARGLKSFERDPVATLRELTRFE